jgi:hypothetical protein
LLHFAFGDVAFMMAGRASPPTFDIIGVEQ